MLRYQTKVFRIRLLAIASMCILGAIGFAGNARAVSQASEKATVPAPTKIRAHDGEKSVLYDMYQQSYALVVGASNYRDAAWDNLDVVPDEIDLIKKVLEAQGFAVTVVNDPDSATLLNSIRDFFRVPHPRDTRMLFYYAGHGYTSKTDRMGYLVPVDAPDDRAQDFFTKLISMQEIRGWLPLGRAKHILLVFDSCFSGYIYKLRKNSMPSPDEIYLSDIDRPGRQFITSGDATETVPDRMDFAEAFSGGVNGKADHNLDTIITASELGYFLKKQIKPLGLQSPQYGVDPGDKERGLNFAGDMVFASSSSGGAAPEDGSKQVEVAFADGLSGPRGANLRSLGEPDSAAGQLFQGIEVLYYRKLSDGNLVSDSLEEAQIPYTVTAADLPDEFETNGIACGPDVPVEAIKTLAKRLIDGGVPLRSIIRFKRPKEKPRRLELLSLTTGAKGQAALSTPLLTGEQIDELEGCPAILQN